MITCDLLHLFPLEFSWHQIRSHLVSDSAPIKSQAGERAFLAEAQDSEHSTVEMSSSQATFVPFQENDPPMSAQASNSSRNAGDSEAKSDPTATDRTNEYASRVSSPSSGMSFADAVKQFQDKLDQDFLQFERELQDQNPQNVVDNFEGWDALENEYQKEIGNVVTQEKDIMDGFDARFKQFLLWMHVSNERETSRALKRIKTQSAFVQHSEGTLVRQEQHYERVMEAFQSAMHLLSQPS